MEMIIVMVELLEIIIYGMLLRWSGPGRSRARSNTPLTGHTADLTGCSAKDYSLIPPPTPPSPSIAVPIYLCLSIAQLPACQISSAIFAVPSKSVVYAALSADAPGPPGPPPPLAVLWPVLGAGPGSCGLDCSSHLLPEGRRIPSGELSRVGRFPMRPFERSPIPRPKLRLETFPDELLRGLFPHYGNAGTSFQADIAGLCRTHGNSADHPEKLGWPYGTGGTWERLDWGT